MQSLCSSSVLSPVDFTEDYAVRETHSDRYLEEGQAKLQSVKQMICNSLEIIVCFTFIVYSLSEDEVDRMWGAERLKQLEAVLQDIDITNDEYIQLFSDQGIQF